MVDPLIMRSTTAPDGEKRDATRSALMVVLTSGVVACIAMFVLGAVIPGPAGEGITLFAPWIIATQWLGLENLVLTAGVQGRRSWV